MIFFWQKNQKISTFGKLENMMKKDCSRKKNVFIFFKILPHKNGKAEKMPVVASHPVYFSIGRTGKIVNFTPTLLISKLYSIRA